MIPFWNILRSLGALVILGLTLINVCWTAACAAESDIQLQLSGAMQGETFQELPLPSSATSDDQSELISDAALTPTVHTWRNAQPTGLLRPVRVGFDEGFVISSPRQMHLGDADTPFQLKLNGWGQLRHTVFESDGTNQDVNQFQLKRARLVFSGHAFTSDFAYFVQLDGRSSSGDDVRLLDYYLTYDIGHHAWGWERRALVFKTGKYKIPFTMARYLSGREFEFADRAMASTFFDVNRSLAWGLGGAFENGNMPWNWEVAVFNGLVTGGAETGSSGQLDDNFAYSGRIFVYPIGDWGLGELADFECHDTLAMRAGIAYANSTIDSRGTTEYGSLRVVDTGVTLASLLPGTVEQYTVNLYSMNVSTKWRGWSTTFEYYFRHIDQFEAPTVGALFDHGLWVQIGKFVVSSKLQLLARWSRVVGNSGTLGTNDQSSEEVAGGAVWYFRDQNAKLTLDATYLNGAPISSAALDINPGDIGWLIRSQIQFAF